MSFASRLKQLASETAIYGVSSILGRMLNYLLVPFYTWVFAPHRYGVVLAMYAAIVVFNIVYTYGMEAAYLTFASESKQDADANETFSTATWTLLGSSIVLSGLLVLFNDLVAAAVSLETRWTYVVNYAAAIVFLDTLAVVPFADLRLQNRPWRFAGIRVAGIVANIGLNILLIVGLDWGIDAVFVANILSSAAVLALLLPVYSTRMQWTFEFDLQKKLLRFGLPFLPSGLGFAMTEVINRTYIGRMSAERVIERYGAQIDQADIAQQTAEAASAYGQYMIGVFGAMIKIGAAMMLLARMFRFAWQPFFLQHANDPDAKPLFSRIFTLYTAVGLLVVLAVSFFADELVAIPIPGIDRHFIEQSYWLGLHVVPLVLLAYLFQGWYYVFSAGLYLTENTIYFIHCTVLGALVTLGLNMWLVPYYGMAAAAWATVAAYGAMAGLLFAITQRVYPIDYAWDRIGAMGALAAVLLLSWLWIESLQRWWIESFLVLLFAGGLILLRIVPLRFIRQVLKRGRMS